MISQRGIYNISIQANTLDGGNILLNEVKNIFPFIKQFLCFNIIKKIYEKMQVFMAY